MCLTYIFFWRAVKAQGVDRSKFAYTGWFQPYSVSHDSPHTHPPSSPPKYVKLTLLQAYIGQGWMIFIILFYGYSSFRPWSVQNFFIYYTMLILGKSESYHNFEVSVSVSNCIISQPLSPSAVGRSSRRPSSSSRTRPTWSGRLPASMLTKRPSTALPSASGAKSFRLSVLAGSRAATTPGGEASLAEERSASRKKLRKKRIVLLICFLDTTPRFFLDRFMKTVSIVSF
jgi:hypothetical protein